MPRKLYLRICLRTLPLICFALPCKASAEDEKPLPEQPKLTFSNEVLADVAAKEWSGLREDGVIEISEQGPHPRDLEMRIRQGILFFYNATKDSKLTFEIDFGKNAMVCYSSATPNLAFKGEGKLTSTRPVLPGNFASTCFPVIGTYAYRIYGIQGQKGPVEGKITVSPRG